MASSWSANAFNQPDSQGDVVPRRPSVRDEEGVAPTSQPLRISALDHTELETMMETRTEDAKNAEGQTGKFMKDEDYKALLRNIGRKQEATTQYKKLAGLLMLFVLLLAVIAFGTTLASVELAKESHVHNGAITDTSGNVVATRSSDFEVCGDGSLAATGKCPAAGASRRLQEDTAADSIKTVPTLTRKALTSSLSDSFFMSLDEVAVFSDKGHSLRIKVHGFARVPVLNSRCGNVVHLYTAWNGRMTLDSVDFSFDAATESAFVNAGFSLATGGVSGRRLAGDSSVDGFFSAVQGVEAQGWTCQDVPLPTLPETYAQRIVMYTPCAVEGVTGNKIDNCDSKYGGVVPGTNPLSRENQLATMTKTQRIKAKVSVDVPIERTLFSSTVMTTMKSASYELQIADFPNHPGQQKVYLFDRRSSIDIHFQVIKGQPAEGRFYCNSSGASEVTPQKQELEAEKAGVDRKVHFELIDMVEDGGRILRHFRMMPAESFLEWMGAKSAADRPVDAYYEYWDNSEDLSPVRLLMPDGSLIHFESAAGGTTDADVEAKLAELGSNSWTYPMICLEKEKKVVEVTAPTLGMSVPMMLSPMSDLTTEDFAFYAKLHLDTQVEDASGNGWDTIGARALGTDAYSQFARYALRSQNPWAMQDVCSDVCTTWIEAVKVEMEANPELDLCDAPSTSALVMCMVDQAAERNLLCMKNNFMGTVHGECAAAGGRRLSEEEFPEGKKPVGGEEYAMLMGKKQDQGSPQKFGNSLESKMTTLKDGTKSIDISMLDAAQKRQIANSLGMERLSAGRVYFNVSDTEPNQQVGAVLEVETGETVHSRRLNLDMACLAPGFGPGCIFSIKYPEGCNPITGSPKCKWGIAVKIQIGGPSNGALSVGASGCIPKWAFGVPDPLDGTVCADGGITVSPTSACGLPFSLSGVVGITATAGLDLVLFSFNAMSFRLEAGAAVENYNYNCDSRRRRRRGWGGRRRGADEECSTGCDIKVYVKLTWQVLIGRVWGMIRYYVRHQDFDVLLGADIWWTVLVTSGWSTVAEVKLI